MSQQEACERLISAPQLPQTIRLSYILGQQTARYIEQKKYIKVYQHLDTFP